MKLSNIGKLGIVALAVALLLTSTSTAQAQTSRVAWVYAGGAGSFSVANSPGQWVERTHLGTVYTFTETQRNFDFVELYDASRGISIRLYSNACYIQHS